jgi:hypothetical protein
LRGRQLAVPVPVTINGQAVGLLLDTGSEKSFLTEATVERLHIPRDARFNTAIIGIGGGSARVDASVDHMLIGGVPLPVDRISVNSFSGRPRFDGLIGLDILRDFDLDIDTPKRTLTLYRVRVCERADPPWDEPAMPIAGISTETRWLKLPFEIDGVAGTATLDTGFQHDDQSTDDATAQPDRRGPGERSVPADFRCRRGVDAGTHPPLRDIADRSDDDPRRRDCRTDQGAARPGCGAQLRRRRDRHGLPRQTPCLVLVQD